MSNGLWQEVLTFNIDGEVGSYLFSHRLSIEKKWTPSFTELAIVEYKKFMYMIAVSGQTLSPSPIVDEVWHLHLTYTSNYKSFCELLGKEIQHIPSNHSVSDKSNMRRFVENTRKTYQVHFGPMPVVFWENEKTMDHNGFLFAKNRWWQLTLYTLAAILVAILPMYFILKPIYSQINSTFFLLGIIGLFSVTLFGLRFYTKRSFKNIWKQLEKENVLFHQHPFELLFLKNGSLTDAINALMNEAIRKGQLGINEHNLFVYNEDFEKKITEDYLIEMVFADKLPHSYSFVFSTLKIQPYFKRFKIGMIQKMKDFMRTKIYLRVFKVNLIGLSIVLFVGLMRLVIGVQREKPVVLITILLIVFFLISVFYPLSLSKQFFSEKMMKGFVVPTSLNENQKWQWDSYNIGLTALMSAFVLTIPQSNDRSGSSCSGSGDSGGDSSCSSCGGCSGD
jgi:hypothetical protein